MRIHESGQEPSSFDVDYFRPISWHRWFCPHALDHAAAHDDHGPSEDRRRNAVDDIRVYENQTSVPVLSDPCGTC
jgi:hypothetical protein